MKYQKVDIAIASGQTEKEFPKSFDSGYNIIGVAFVHKTGATENVDVQIETEGGTKILDFLDLNFLKKGDQGFTPNTFFPLNISSTTALRINVKTPTALADDFKGQLLFALQPTDEKKAACAI